MRTSIFALLAIVVGAVAISRIVARRRGTKPEEDRFLEARFGSIGTGINEEALDVVLDVVCEGTRRGRVVRVLSRTWGIEGERDFCVQYATGEALRQDLARIRARLPKQNAMRPLPTLRTTRECIAATSGPPFAEINPCTRS